MQAIQFLVDSLIDIFILVLIVSIVMSWLIAFGVVNRYNRVVDAVYGATQAITEPVLGPIRRVLPNMGGLDLSPIVAFLGLRALQIFLNAYIFAPAIRQGY